MMTLEDVLNEPASVIKDVNIDGSRIFLQSETKKPVNVRKRILYK